MAPEQVIGRSGTGASDRYALGIIAHELLTGRTPFQAENPEWVGLGLTQLSGLSEASPCSAAVARLSDQMHRKAEPRGIARKRAVQSPQLCAKLLGQGEVSGVVGALAPSRSAMAITSAPFSRRAW
jgi:serine/threonine protein kinase